MAEEIGIAAASEVASKVTESVYDFIQRQISYVFKYQSYVDGLKKQFQDLENARERVKHQVEEAERQGEEIEKDAEQWLKRVDEFTEGVVKSINDDEDKANKRCFKGLCPNFIKRYTLSKKAAKAAEVGGALLVKGNFNSVSHRSLPRRTKSKYVNDDYEHFDSRMSNFQEIMEALKDSSVNMIGVHGMGGVGKTTLVKNVAWQAKEDKLFDKVVMAEVTQTPDMEKIQGEIADQLGLVFKEESVSGRADRLCDRLKKEKRILIILDNIWKRLDFKAVGLPSMYDDRETVKHKEAWEGRNDNQSNRCTILLTSRNRDVLCKDMKTQKNIFIHPLSDGDAWNLFWKIVGDSAEKSDFHRTADEIVKKCAGLPVALSTIANALKNESLSTWEDALAQLKRSNPRRILDMDETLYSTIELSYNFLKNEEAKQLFLLCAYKDAGRAIFTSDLLKYSMGLNLFRDIYKLEEGRNRLHALIERLKASCLLLDGITNDTVKMHDIIHAVAVSIASTYKFMFNIQNTTVLKEVLEENKDSIAVSLPYRDISDELPERLECSRLKLFLLLMKNHSLQIPDHFLRGMKELQVLDFTRIKFLSLPSSLCCLKNLRTLCLDSCQLGDVAIVGELKTLEILSFLKSDIVQLPWEIGQLTRLKMLDLSNCTKLKVIPPNVISSLSRLEELYMGNSFDQWETEGVNNQGQRNASLGELKKLSHLTALHIHILNARIMPQDLLFELLKSYKIFIGPRWNWSGKYDLSTSRTFKLKINDNIHLGHAVKTLLISTEDLCLDEMKGITNVLDQLDGGGFPYLKHLHVQDGLELLYIVNSVPCKLAFPKLESLSLHNLINLEKICHGELKAESFCKLRIIKIEKCDRLKYLFSSLVAKKLSQLQEMEVTDCKNLKEIFGQESEEYHVDEIGRNGKIEFTQLRTLTLQSLPQFISFGFNMEVILPRLENLKLSSMNIENIWLDQLDAESFHKLRIIKIKKCDRLKYLFSSCMAESLSQLQEMEVTDCMNLKEIFGQESEEYHVDEFERNSKFEFTQLRTLTLQSLPQFFNVEVMLPRLENLKLSSINIDIILLGQHPAVSFYSQCLKSLTVESCDSLKFLFSSSMVKSLMQLQELVIGNCNSMEAVIETEELGEETTIDMSFPNLFYLKLKGLSKLTRFGTGHFVKFPSLNELHIESCSTLETFFTNSFCSDSVRKKSEGVKLENCLTDVNPLFDEKVAFPSLEQMTLLHLDNLQLIWHNQLHADSFCKLKVMRIECCEKLMTIVPSNTQGLVKFENLERLIVRGCRNIKSLFPISIATRLMQLKVIKIVHCRLEEIVAKDDVEGPHRFVFPQLTHLILQWLPELKYFYLGLHTIVWPVLHHLTVIGCKKLKIYAYEFPSFQKTDGESQPALFVFEKVIPSLDTLGLSDDSIASICLDPIPAKSLCKLKHLWLFNFDEESEAFLFGFFQRLYCLETFHVFDSSFKELFPYEGHIWQQDSQIGSCVQDLQQLEVGRCHHLKCLNMSSSASFTNLTTLIIWCCDGLENIFTCSTVKRLVQLKEMRIKECKLLAEVIATEIDKREEEMVFCQLKVLVLYRLSSLTCFCSTNYDFKFPRLEQVIVSGCPKLNIFSWGLLSTPELKRVQLTLGKDEETDEEYFWKDDLNSTIQQMFTIMVGFRNLEHLKLSEFPTLKEKIWNAQVPIGLFKNLKRLVVDEFSDMSSAIQSNVLCHFKNLETLEVRSCDSLSQVFDIGGHLNDDGHTLGQSHQQILSFNNLKSLKVHNCHNIRYIFTPSIILGLVQLQEIKIENCALIEEIITKEGEKDAVIDKIIIPQLKIICLKSLLNLTSFYSGSKILEFPPLEIIIIKDCQKILLRDFNLHLASLFTKEVVFPTLDDLALSSMSAEHSQLPTTSSFFQNLKILNINGFDHVNYLFSSSVVKSLVQLEVLEISNCNFIEEIIVEEEEKISNMLFPKLKVLHLFDLRRLTRFCNSAGDFVELSSLSNLAIKNCPSMKTFIFDFICGDMTSSKQPEEINSEENFHTHLIQPLFDKKVRLPSLDKLWINRMDELGKIWDDQLSLDSFCKLKILDVRFCNKLVNIFPSNMFGIHKKLEIFYVENCDLVEEIFQVVEKSCCEGIVKEEAAPRFVFSKLTLLSLKMLPSLKGLYPGTHISEWSILKQLEVYGCDKVEIFASEFLSFQGTHGQSQDEITVQQPLFSVDKDAFPRLEKLHLHELPELLHLWRENSQPSNDFQNLKTLKVSKCGNLEILLSSSMSCQNLMSLQVSECDGLRYLLTLSKAKTLVHLISLNVSDCKMMEQIITNSRDEVKDPIVFSKLDILELHCLPSLTSFCCGDFTLEFPSLEKVIVRHCLKMETFSHGGLSTPKLQRLQLTQGEDEVEESWEGSLNSTIQHLFKKQLNVKSSEEDQVVFRM